MKSFLSTISLFLFIGQTQAQVSLYMTHVQKEYDEKGKLKAPIENLISRLSDQEKQIVVLHNNLEHWQTKLSGQETVAYSQYGEHTIAPLYSDVYLVGAQLGACLQFTIRDLLKMAQGKRINIHVDPSTMLSIEGERLSEILGKLSDAEGTQALHRYFSRTLFTDNNPYVKKAKINLSWRGEVLGSLKDKGIKKAHKKPNLVLSIE